MLQAATRLGGLSLDQVELFVHGRVVDTSKLGREFGFVPRSTRVAFDDFIESHQDGTVVTPQRVDSLIEKIRGVRLGRDSR
jgi:UDP-glucose 4-epimerase